ncbi:MAG: CDP-diacylglycerol--serine O-phosphatidyltransferase [Gammaproteobacteria bacterium]
MADNELDEAGRRRRGIYLLPNLFTTATLFGGFYAIVAAMNGKFEAAAIAIGAAMVADSLDGLVARMTHTASDFGKEYDSLCDMVAFGVAASIVMYTYSLHHLAAQTEWLGGKLGWVTAFAYTSCAALRLARFNVLATRGGTKGAFFGLPSPAAAALVVGFVWAFSEEGWKGQALVIPATILTWLAAVLMVTNFRFFSIKQLGLADRVPFRYFVVALGILVLFLVFPTHWVVFLGFLGYALSGPTMAAWRRFVRREAAQPIVEDREPPKV